MISRIEIPLHFLMRPAGLPPRETLVNRNPQTPIRKTRQSKLDKPTTPLLMILVTARTQRLSHDRGPFIHELPQIELVDHTATHERHQHDARVHGQGSHVAVPVVAADQVDAAAFGLMYNASASPFPFLTRTLLMV